MQRLRAFCAAVLAMCLVGLPVWGAAPSVAPLGTVIAGEHAHVGQGTADVGTTVYSGDYLSTEMQGSVQVRAGAARLLLQSASSVIVNQDEGVPSAKLLSGTATFSTANARAFTLFASSAAIRPSTDAPTIGQVKYVSEKELVVTARRGGLAITVEDQTQTIAEGTSYRVLLDPPADAQQPAGAGAGGQGPAGSGGGPLKAGRSRFLIIATALIAAGTGVAIYEAMESSDRP
jgi:ferric-dicitrate binding protein FerR (iron transport regulator)